MTMELLFDLHVLRLQHANTLLLIAFIDFFVHGLFLNNLLGDVECLAGALLMQHRSPVGGLYPCIQAAVLPPRSSNKGPLGHVSIRFLSL